MTAFLYLSLQEKLGQIYLSHVLSIALDVGYESDASFTRAFKRLVGMPPATWRRMQNKEQEIRNGN